MLRAVIFDLGGTLLHYESASADLRELNTRGFAALYHYLSSNGRTAVPEAAVLNAIASHAKAEWQAALASSRGGSVETPLKAALAELGISLSDVEWQAARRAFYAPIQEAAEPRQGVRPTLQALNEQGVALGLLSNTFWAGDIHDEDLARFDLLDLLPTRLYSCDIGRLKPHPEAFQMALTALEVEPNQAVYVGDRLKTDIEPAREVGLWGVLIKTPFHEEPLEDVMPDAVISELPELARLLEHRT
jgi:putative hydrolase of the HAD superfamily